jgi:hypothetical protein
MPSIFVSNLLVNDYDRAAALSSIIALCYRRSDRRRVPYFRPLRPFFGKVSSKELTQACRIHGLDPDHLTVTPFGRAFEKTRTCGSNYRRAFLWLLKKPERVAAITFLYDLACGFDHQWAFAESLLSGWPTLIIAPPKRGQRLEVFEMLLSALNKGPATLVALDDIASGDCRKRILELRAMGHDITISCRLDQNHATIIYITINNQLKKSQALDSGLVSHNFHMRHLS